MSLILAPGVKPREQRDPCSRGKDSIKIAIFASGEGTNFQFLADNFKNKIALLVCNQKEANVLNRAQKSGIPFLLIEHQKFNTREEHEQEILKTINAIENLKTIVLAGYMRILSPYFFAHLNSEIEIINLHPAHLHDYKGPSGYEFAIANKFPRWGITVHKVIPELDSGPIVKVKEVSVLPTDTPDCLKKRCQKVEHELLASYFL